MALLTLSSTAENEDGSQSCLLNIEPDGLVVEGFGKIPWDGSTMSIEADESACRIVLTGADGSEAKLVVSADCFGGSEGVSDFATWLAVGAASSGTTIVNPVAV